MSISERQLSSEQQRAVELSCDMSERIVSITGGAGTGKTTVIRHIYDQMKGRNRVALCAPTGRAAKRIQEATGIAAKTIHRLLEFPMPDETDVEPNKPKRNSNYRLNENVVIIDEASMITPTLFRQLMDAMRPQGVVRLIGDNNQLPPVNDREDEGKPAPFPHMLVTKPAITLTFNYRSQDAIISNSMRVLEGSIPERNDRFHIYYVDHPLRTLITMLTPIYATAEHQVIVPTRRGTRGTERINVDAQRKLNYHAGLPQLLLDRFSEDAPPMPLRLNDKWLWTRNDYQLDLLNGDIGMVEHINEDDGSVFLSTLDRLVHVPSRIRTFSAYHGHHINYDPRKQIDLGYAVTTHKSQGSEFDSIIYLLCESHGQAINRANFYTAITRARHEVTIIAERGAMRRALRERR